MATYDEKRKILTAERLKALREGKKLSHEALADKLSEKYGKSISRDVLINYEISDQYHSKFNTGFGMRIEYIANLADFYEVSTDYLLGMTDTKSVSEKIKSSCQYTKLSESALEKLHEYVNDPKRTLCIKILSFMLENGHVQRITDILNNSLIKSYEYKLIYDDITGGKELDELVSTNELAFNKFAINLYKEAQEKLDKRYKSEIQQIVSNNIQDLIYAAQTTKDQMEDIIKNFELKNKPLDEQAAFVRGLIEEYERGKK